MMDSMFQSWISSKSRITIIAVAILFSLVVGFPTHCQEFTNPNPAFHSSKIKRVLRKVATVATNHVTLGFAAGGSNAFASGGTFACRANNPDVEHCTAHYGSANITETARAGFTVGMIAWSEYGRKHGFKDWFVPVVATTAFNVFWGIREFRTHEKPEPIILK